MSLEDTLVEVRELLVQRDEIDARLSELMNVGPKPPAISKTKPAKGKPGRKKNACSGCGKPGHRVTTCQKTKDSDAKIRSTFGDVADDDRKPIATLTERDFDKLKELQKSGDLSTRIFATEHDLPLPEVNRALGFRHFEDYVG